MRLRLCASILRDRSEGCGSAETARRGGDSNPRCSCPHTGFRNQPDQPLRHLSLNAIPVGLADDRAADSATPGLSSQAAAPLPWFQHIRPTPGGFREAKRNPQPRRGKGDASRLAQAPPEGDDFKVRQSRPKRARYLRRRSASFDEPRRAREAAKRRRPAAAD